MRLLVISYKIAWPSVASPTGYATDGGFPFQMKALSELFDSTTLLVPCLEKGKVAGEGNLTGYNLSVLPLSPPAGKDLWRKMPFPLLLTKKFFVLPPGILRPDAGSAPIPVDTGPVGMLLAYLLKKPLFIRYCGNWLVQATIAEQFWKWFIETVAGGRNVCLATGELLEPPSRRNPELKWIFATALPEEELRHCATERRGFHKQNPKLIVACRQEKEKGTGKVIESLKLLQDDF